MGMFNDEYENRIYQLEQRLIKLASIFESVENIDQAEKFFDKVIAKSKDHDLVICIDFGPYECDPIRRW